MTGGGSKVMKGRMGSSVVEVSEEEVSTFYSHTFKKKKKQFY